MRRRKAKRKMNDKQALTVIISVVVAAVLLIGALVVIGPILGGNENADPHAGHNHAAGEDCSTGATDSHTDHDTGNDQVKYQLYTNADKTYRVVFRDASGKTLHEEDKLPNMPIKEAVNADKGVYELSWATGTGPNDFTSIYYNVVSGQVSDTIHAARGCDGVRVAYGSKDQTKIIVQDVFDKDAYYKEHALNNPYTKGDDIIVSGKLRDDKKSVVISYAAGDNGAYQHATINLYD